MKKKHLSILLFLFILTGCKDFFGSKTDLDFIEVPIFEPREVAYVPIQPVISGFSKPTSIIAGFDELMYVLDEGTSEIICFDESGREIGRKFVPGAKAMAQTRKLDLLVIGEIPQNFGDSNYIASCIYRLDLVGSGGYGLRNAKITDTIIHPFYYTSQADLRSRKERVSFTDIGVLADNRFYVTRTGTNTPNVIFGPDDAVLLFDADGKLIRNVSVSTPDGLVNNFFKQPTAITTYIQPPQFTARGGDAFIVAMKSVDAAIKVRIIDYTESEFGAAYEPRILIDNSENSDGFLYTPNKFITPTGLTVSGDGTNFIFVVDQELDSIYQFNASGLEGVPPPPGAISTRLAKASFGGRGLGLSQFNKPTGIAYQSRTLWVTDTGNGRVLRFKLTLDIR
jgi:hypothetical protein